jgi:DNA primase catalytic core
MSLDPHTNSRVKCFACGASYDIFKVCSIVEKKPERGPGWIYENVYHLAKLFKLSFDEIEPTEEELRYIQYSNMYDDAADVLVAVASTDEATEYPRKRGLTKETCVKFGVAQVDTEYFYKEMEKRGHAREVLENVGLTSDMFAKDRVTFVLRDLSGWVIGFSRKYLLYDKTAHKMAKANKKYYPPKYVNTSSDVPFFDKSSFLYGIHYARVPNNRRIDLYEGYFDFLFAYQSGITNCAAVSGTALTGSQVELIKQVGFSHVNIVFDSEPEGCKAAEKMMDTFSGYEGLYLTITFLPFEDDVPPADRDPDEFIKRYGIQSYHDLELYSAFDWRLNKMIMDGAPAATVSEIMLPQILNESSILRRSELLTKLSEATKYQVEVLRAELDRLADKSVRAITEQVMTDLHRARDSKKKAEILRGGVAQIDEIIGRQGQALDYSWEESHRAFIEACTSNETPGLEIGGWKTGWVKFDESFDGLPKEGSILGIAGAPNCGKSAWLTSLIMNLLINNTEGLSVVFHVLDDPRHVAFAKLMSALTGIPIGHILRAEKYVLGNPALGEAYRRARGWIETQMRTGKLIVKGQELGNDIELAEHLIDSVITKTGNKVVYVADSFHSLDDKRSSEERIRYKRVAEWSMRVTETRKITMVFTVELTKVGMDGRPRLHMLAETGKLAYALKAVGLVYNELHDKRNLSCTHWLDKVEGEQEPVRRPILEVEWAKNKISGFKGNQYLKFHDELAYLEEISRDDVLKIRQDLQSSIVSAPKHQNGKMLSVDSMVQVKDPFVLS